MLSALLMLIVNCLFSLLIEILVSGRSFTIPAPDSFSSFNNRLDSELAVGFAYLSWAASAQRVFRNKRFVGADDISYVLRAGQIILEESRV